MSHNKPVKNLNKASLERLYRTLWDCYFDIELHEGVMYVRNDLHLEVEIPYSSVKEKAEIYNLLGKIPTIFDFSYTLEFCSLADLRDWVETADRAVSAYIAKSKSTS